MTTHSWRKNQVFSGDDLVTRELLNNESIADDVKDDVIRRGVEEVQAMWNERQR